MPFYSTSSPTSGNATQLQGRAIAATAPAVGHVLVWDGSAWVPSTGSPGPTGPAGVDAGTWYSGSGAPTGTFGRSGDWWVDTTNGRLYGPRANGSWGSPLQLQSGPAGPTGPAGTSSTGPTGAAGQSFTGATGVRGATGARGTQWYSGLGAPQSSLGLIGDMYLDTAAVAIYGPKGAGGWSTGLSLRGPTGPTGP